MVRAAGEPLQLAPQVRDALRALQPTVAVERVTTMAEIRRASTAAPTFALRLLAGFAIVATLLAAVGLYGVLSLSVGARTKELALRQAIGARRHQVIGLVLGEGARLVAVGVAGGIAGALLVGRLLQALLFDVSATESGGPRSARRWCSARSLRSPASCRRGARDAATSRRRSVRTE